MKPRRLGGRSSAAVPFSAVLLSLAVVIAACGSSSGSTPSPSPLDSPGPSSGASASPADSPPASSIASPGGSPSPDASTGSAAGPSASPGAGASASPSEGTSVKPAPGPITTPEQAAALVLASDPRFAGIGPFDPDLIGQSAWYTVERALGGWTVVVEIGWGDCPSGCIERHTWTYSVSKNGTMKLVSETGPSIPSDVIPAG